MTHVDSDRALNETLKHTIFSKIEIEKLEHTKDNVLRQVPKWAHNHFALVVAGGAWASSIQGTRIKDIDIFVLDNCTDEVKEDIRALMKNTYGVGAVHNTTDSYNRNNDKVTEVWRTTDKFVQIIFTKHKTRKELIEDFDYVHCKASYWGEQLYITRQIYDAIVKMQLIPNNQKNIQQWRREKFIDRGYKELGEQAPVEMNLGDILAAALKTGVKKYA